MELIFAGSTKTREQWDELYSVEHPKVTGSLTPIWYYDKNECTECNGALIICKHNPYRAGGEIRTQLRIAQLEALAQKNNESMVESTDPLTGEVTTAAVSNRRKHGSVQKALPEGEAREEALRRYDVGDIGATALAKELNVAPPWLSMFLKNEGREVKKGKGRKPSDKIVKELSANELQEVIAKQKSGTTVQILAKEYNINPAILSGILKANGCVIKKGQGRKPSGTVRKELDSNELKQVLAKFDEAITVTELSKEYHINPAILSGILKANGRVIKKGNRNLGKMRKARATAKPVQVLDEQKVLKLFKKHGTVKAIVEATGYPQLEVSAMLKANGITPTKGRRKVVKA